MGIVEPSFNFCKVPKVLGFTASEEEVIKSFIFNRIKWANFIENGESIEESMTDWDTIMIRISRSLEEGQVFKSNHMTKYNSRQVLTYYD